MVAATGEFFHGIDQDEGSVFVLFRYIAWLHTSRLAYAGHNPVEHGQCDSLGVTEPQVADPHSQREHHNGDEACSLKTQDGAVPGEIRLGRRMGDSSFR